VSRAAADRLALTAITPHNSLDTLHLDTGSHGDASDGLCLMEAVAWFAREPHTDAPRCVSPVLQTFGTRLNDCLPDRERQALIPLIPRLVGAVGDGLDEARSYLALDWLIRTYTPAWLDLAGLSDSATGLRGLRRIADLTAAEAAGPVVQEAKTRATAAWDVAEGAAEGAARAAAWAAAEVAAEAVARGAAGVAARAAAWAVAEAAAEAAARAAARGALQPTVDTLQNSAINLFTLMIRPQGVQG
jgi:hypothetical protein